MPAAINFSPSILPFTPVFQAVAATNVTVTKNVNTDKARTIISSQANNIFESVIQLICLSFSFYFAFNPCQ